jgi:hypothetical protein
MNKRTIYTHLIIAIAAIVFFSGCKKNNPTIVGNWKFSNYTASTQVYYPSYGDSANGTYSYNAKSQSINYILYHSKDLPHLDTQMITTLKYSNWDIRSDGTYSIDEDAYNDAVTTSGIWEYMSNTSSNNAVTFQGGGSMFFQIFYTQNTFVIQSVTDKQLVLTYSNSSISDSTGAFGNSSETITFTK